MTSNSTEALPLRPARSLLFVPADRPQRFAKAVDSGAHQVVLDLEDAVAPAAKDIARNEVSAWLAAGRRAVVRINAADTPWFADDLRLLRSLPGAELMLPKAEPEATAQAAAALQGRPLIALLETARGLAGLEAVASTPGVVRIAFGSVDFCADTGIEDEGEALTCVRIRLVLASRLAGLAPPVDGVSVEFTDLQRMQQHALRSRQLGFGGKLCIHPRQVSAVHAAFRPSEADRAWAGRVLAAFEASGGAATSVDGKMVDKPVVERARQIVAEAALA